MFVSDQDLGGCDDGTKGLKARNITGNVGVEIGFECSRVNEVALSFLVLFWRSIVVIAL